jgi:hypothetical protein
VQGTQGLRASWGLDGWETEMPRRASASSKAAAADLEFWVLCGDSGAHGCFLSLMRTSLLLIIYREVLIYYYFHQRLLHSLLRHCFAAGLHEVSASVLKASIDLLPFLHGCWQACSCST